MAKKFYSKALSVGLSLALCAGMVAPAFAASYADLQGVINSQKTLYVKDESGADTENVRIGYAGGTVTLHEDVERGEEESWIHIREDVTIDLNGHDIVDETTQSGQEATYNIIVNPGKTLTIEDNSEGRTAGTIKTDNTYGIYNNGGTLNLNDGTIEVTNEKGRGVFTTGITTVSENVKVDSKFYGVQVNGGTLTTKGDIDGTMMGVAATKGSVIVNGGEIDGKYGVRVSGADTSAEISGGKITGGPAGVMIERGAIAKIKGDNTVITGSSTNAAGKVNGAGITIWDNSKLIIDGGNISGNAYGVAGNGNVDDGNLGKSVIDINGGTIKGGHTGIYHPQVDSWLNINGGDIIGEKTGIEIRSGNLTVKGGTITGNDNKFSVTPNGNGVTTSGVGIAIVQHVTKYPVTVTIEGGTITGGKSIYEANVQKNEDEAIEKVKPTITGGKFISTDKSVESEDEEYFVTGGLSSEYIEEKYWGEVDNSNYETSSLQNGMNKVGCYGIEDGELPYQVGYLTAGTSTPNVSLTVENSANLPLTFYLNNEAVNGTVLTDVDWSIVSGANAISLNADGTVTGLEAGSAIVTATLHNGETVTFEIVVSAVDPGTGDDVIDDGFIDEDPGVEIEDPTIPLAGLFTRADAIGYLWEQTGSPDAELSDFPDVPEDHQWAVAIGWAQDMGIALPDEDGNFRPDDLVLRSSNEPEGELQQFLDRYAVFAGVELAEGKHFYAVEGALDDIIMGEDAQVIFDEFFAKLEAALTEQAA